MNFGLVQKMLLAQGLRMVPDFTILPFKMQGRPQFMIVGKEKNVRELADLIRMQTYIDLMSHPKAQLDPEARREALRALRGKGVCKAGDAGINCFPIHRRIGELLGYTPEQVNELRQLMAGDSIDRLPDIDYRGLNMPTGLRDEPRQPGFTNVSGRGPRERND